MAFLKSILALLVPLAMNWAKDQVLKLVARLTRRKEVQKQAEESVKPIEEAKTKEEIDASVKDTLSGL